jgi:polyketide biosynthesis enoyl-CoA hydratase PksI
MENVVRLNYIGSEIAVVVLEDRINRNTFSRALIEGLMNVFNIISQNNMLKVVVIHGYDNYFCCGGTKEELLNIFSGKITFNDLAFYRLLLDCEIPTIAAMQGHAIGGGLAFACYADLMVIAEECLYSTNFMKYGFTPGMGATYMVPEKFGNTIGHEMLYGAKNYHGGILRDRGISIPVVKKIEVIPTALSLAKELADKPRTSLTLLKQHLIQHIKQTLPMIIEQELAMHQITFSQPEVKQRIDTLFGS